MPLPATVSNENTQGVVCGHCITVLHHSSPTWEAGWIQILEAMSTIWRFGQLLLHLTSPWNLYTSTCKHANSRNSQRSRELLTIDCYNRDEEQKENGGVRENDPQYCRLKWCGGRYDVAPLAPQSWKINTTNQSPQLWNLNWNTSTKTRTREIQADNMACTITFHTFPAAAIMIALTL